MMRWEKVHVKPIEGEGGEAAQWPGKRWGHTCEAIKGGQFLYLFGGYGHNCKTSQVHVFDAVKQTWSQPVIKGIPPSRRDSHTCTAIGDNLFVFGGTDGTNLFKDLYILDTSSHTWLSPTTRGEGPNASEGHSAACVGRRLFIFGGRGKSIDSDVEVHYNDLYIFNTETFVWKHAATSGSPPSPRDGHTCSSWKNNVVVIGGEDEHDNFLSDVHILDTDTLIWRKMNTSGQFLPPRAGHSTVALGKNFFVFGGFSDAQTLYNDLYKLDVDSGIWTKVTTTGRGPSPRFCMAGGCLDPFMGGVLVFIGGCNKSLDPLGDMYYLHTEFASGTEPRPEKLSMRKQLKLKCQENLNSLQNQAHGAGIHLPVPLPSIGKMFKAIIIDSNSVGFTIETAIDGKTLRGFLFSDNPASLTSRQKRTADEIGVVNKLNTSKVLKENYMEGRQADDVHGVSSVSHEHSTEAVAAPVSSSTTTFEPFTLSDLMQFPVYPRHEAASMNRDDDKNDGTAKCFGGNSRYDGSNVVPISNDKIPRHDQTGETTDCTTPRTEEHSGEPAKSSCSKE